ncbi:MAG: fatty acid desaturase, partial [Granulosicoccaceae bacterium]
GATMWSQASGWFLTRRDNVFKHKEDRLPTLLIVTLTVIDFILYFNVESPWVLLAYWIVMIIPKGTICAWNHHHQHAATFKSVPLNRLMEQVYALHSGQTTNLWLLHHVLGHHYNFLDQTKDESRWKREDGAKMGVLEYTLDVTLTAYPRAYQVGKAKPMHARHLHAFVLFGSVTALILLALVLYKPLQGFFLFALPMFVSLMFTAWTTYDHHAGLDTDNEFEASYNIINPLFNKLTGNLGYHTAHHYRQGVHWSKLPALHEKIKHKIPDELYVRSTFDILTNAQTVTQRNAETKEA